MAQKVDLYYLGDNKANIVYIQGFVTSAPSGWKKVTGQIPYVPIEKHTLCIKGPMYNEEKAVENEKVAAGEYYYELPKDMVSDKYFGDIQFQTWAGHNLNLPENRYLWEEGLGPDIRIFGVDCFKNCDSFPYFLYINNRPGVNVTFGCEALTACHSLKNIEISVPNGNLFFESEVIAQEENSYTLDNLIIKAGTLTFLNDNGTKNSPLEIKSINKFELKVKEGKINGDIYVANAGKERKGILETNVFNDVRRCLLGSNEDNHYFNEIVFTNTEEYPFKPADNLITIGREIGYNNEITKELILNFTNLTKETLVNLKINIESSLLTSSHLFTGSDFSNYKAILKFNGISLADMLNSCKLTWLQDYDTLGFKTTYGNRIFYQLDGNLINGNDKDITVNSTVNEGMFAGNKFKTITIEKNASIKKGAFSSVTCQTLIINGYTELQEGVFDGMDVNKIEILGTPTVNCPCFKFLGRSSTPKTIEIVISKNELNFPQCIPSNFITNPLLGSKTIKLNWKDSAITTINSEAFDNRILNSGTLSFQIESFPQTLREVSGDCFTAFNLNLAADKTQLYTEIVDNMTLIYWVTTNENIENNRYWLLKTKTNNESAIGMLNNRFVVNSKTQGIAQDAFKEKNLYWSINNQTLFMDSDGNKLDTAFWKDENEESKILQGGLDFSLCNHLQAIGSNAFYNTTLNSVDGTIGLGFNFMNTALKYLGPGALSIQNSIPNNTTDSNAKNLLIILPIDSLETLYETSLPLFEENAQNGCKKYYPKTEIQLYANTYHSIMLKKWLTLNKVQFGTAVDYNNGLRYNLILWGKDNGNNYRKNIISSIVLGSKNKLDFDDQNLESEFQVIELNKIIEQGNSYIDQTVYIEDGFTISKGALVNINNIRNYYINFNKIKLEIQSLGKLPFDSENKINLICKDDNDSLRKSNTIFYGYNENQNEMYFDKIRIPSWGVHHYYSWLNSRSDKNISIYYACNCKLYDSVDYAPVYDVSSGVDMRISATLKLIPGKSSNSLYLPDILGTYFISSSPNTYYFSGFGDGWNKNKFKLEYNLSYGNKQKIIPNFYFSLEEESSIKINQFNIIGALKGIGVGAFKNCDEITQLSISSSLEFIGEDAFIGCTSLTAIYYNGTPQEWYKILFGNKQSNPFCALTFDTIKLENTGFYFQIEGEQQIWKNKHFTVPKKTNNSNNIEGYDPKPFWKYPIKGLEFSETHLNTMIEEIFDSSHEGIEYIIFNKNPKLGGQNNISIKDVLFSDITYGNNKLHDRKPNLQDYYPNLKAIYIGNRQSLEENLLRDLGTELSAGDKLIEELKIFLPNNLVSLQQNSLWNCYAYLSEWNCEDIFSSDELKLTGKTALPRATFASLKYSNRCGLFPGNNNPNVEQVMGTEKPNNSKSYYCFKNDAKNFLLYIGNAIDGEDDLSVFENVKVINLGCIMNYDKEIRDEFDINYIKSIYLPWLGTSIDDNYHPEDKSSLNLLSFMYDNRPTRIKNVTLGNPNIVYHFDPVFNKDGLAPFTGIYFGNLEGNEVGTLTINYKEIIGPIANRNHFSNEHYNIESPWPVDLKISTPTIPSYLLSWETNKSDKQQTLQIRNLILESQIDQQVYTIKENAFGSNSIKNIYLNQLDAEGKHSIVFENKAFSPNLINENIYFNRPLEEWLNRIEFENATANPLQYCINLYASNDEGLTYEKRRYVNPKPAKIEGNNIIYYINNYALQGNRQINSFDFNPTVEDNLEGFDPTITYRIKLLTSKSADIHSTGSNYALIQCFNGTNNQINIPDDWAYAFQPKTTEKTQIITPKEEEIKNDE